MYTFYACANPGHFLFYFQSFQPQVYREIVDFSRNQTRIIRIEGEHWTTLPPPPRPIFIKLICHSIHIVIADEFNIFLYIKLSTVQSIRLGVTFDSVNRNISETWILRQNLFKMSHSQPLFKNLIFPAIKEQYLNVLYKSCWRLDSNLSSLSEAIALPTVPPTIILEYLGKFILVRFNQHFSE